MRAIGVKALKNKLSEYVRLAEQGETILVTDRDRVIAELGPPQPDRRGQVSGALLAAAVRQGHLTPPIRTAAGPPPREPVVPLADLLRELSEDRDAR